jgi:hypothetical protein
MLTFNRYTALSNKQQHRQRRRCRRNEIEENLFRILHKGIDLVNVGRNGTLSV